MRSCLFRLSVFMVIFIGVIFCVLYFLTKEKPYQGIHERTEGNTVTIFLIDGLSKSIFQELLDKGKLPNFQRLIEKSTYIENGIGAFPSMTGYGFYPFITGEDATHSGIMGLRWFDRSRDTGNLRHYVGRTNIHMNTDIKPLPQTLFETYSQYYTSSINTYMNRGVHHAEMTGWAHTTSKFQSESLFKYLRKTPIVGEDISKNHFQHESMVMQKAIMQVQRNPKVQWVTFPGPDASNHIVGTTQEYYDIVTHIDSLIGNFIAEVKRLGQEETRMIAVITDHGISDVNQNLDIPDFLSKNYNISLIRGQAAHVYSDQLTEKLTDFVDKDGYFVINGNLCAYIYFREKGENPTPQYWRKKQSFESLEQYINGKSAASIIANIEGVELVACQKNDSTISIFSADGRSDIVFNSKFGYRYSVFQNDPLHYTADSLLKKMISSTFYTANEWLEASLKTEYPDAIFRLYQLMQSEKVGDLLITSKKGYDVAANYEPFVSNFKGGHGGLRSELLNVPYILYMPKTEPKRLKYLRAEDVGKKIKTYLEGKNNEVVPKG